jgi:hypothetical protein
VVARRVVLRELPWSFCAFNSPDSALILEFREA